MTFACYSMRAVMVTADQHGNSHMHEYVQHSGHKLSKKFAQWAFLQQDSQTWTVPRAQCLPNHQSCASCMLQAASLSFDLALTAAASSLLGPAQTAP